MKKLLFALMLMTATAHADDRWVMPLIGGVVAGVLIEQSIQPQGYYTPPVYVETYPVRQQYIQEYYYPQRYYGGNVREYYEQHEYRR